MAENPTYCFRGYADDARNHTTDRAADDSMMFDSV